MTLYDFECVSCGDQREISFPLDKCPESVLCHKCGERAIKIIVNGHGGIQCDSVIDVPWLPSAIEAVQPDGEPPIQSRGEFQAYLDKHGLRPKA